MIPVTISQLWDEYLGAERIRVRQRSIDALKRFTDAVTLLPAEIWHPWARELAMRVVDDREVIPIRIPLFRVIIFPALHAGLTTSIPGCARWLAGFGQLLYHSPECSKQLPEHQRTEHGLLLSAVRMDDTDIRAKRRLVLLLRSRFDYVLHELPAGVLYSHDGATSEQCGELLAELSDYDRFAQEVGREEVDRELIEEARFHIPAYQRYLSQLDRYSSYEQFLTDQGCV